MKKIALKTTFVDKYHDAGKYDITRIQKGFVSTVAVLGYVDKRLIWSKRGGMPEGEFHALVQSLKNGYDITKPITIFVEKNRSISVVDGNHRILAARRAGVGEVYVEIRYFGNSDDNTDLKYVLTGERRDMVGGNSSEKIQKLTKSLEQMLIMHDKMMKRLKFRLSYFSTETICEMEDAMMEAVAILEEVKGYISD